MKTLHLTLKKKWFDMVASGLKKEEYRTIKPYWTKRLSNNFDAVLFRNGYGKNAPSVLVELKDLRTGRGWLKWGAPPNEEVYILELGKILEKNVPYNTECAMCDSVVKFTHRCERKTKLEETESWSVVGVFCDKAENNNSSRYGGYYSVD